MEEKKFQPFVPADKVVPEFTVFSVILGAILAVVFGGANAYLGLRVGMTVSASIPAAVISMGVIRKILKRDSPAEPMVCTMLFSRMESRFRIFRITPIEITAAGMDAETVIPTRRPR